MMMLNVNKDSTLVLCGEALPNEALHNDELMDKWYVFFIRTGLENIICDYLNKLIDTNSSIAFYPKIESFFKTSKILKKEIKPLFQGYIFIKSKIPYQNFVLMIQPIINRSKYNIKLLNKHKPEMIMISDCEKERIVKYCDTNYIIRKSAGVKEGDKVKIITGPLKGYESQIKRIDRHKMRAEIKMEFMGDNRSLYLPLEIIRKN